MMNTTKPKSLVSTLTSRENFEGLANLTELVVSLSHILWVLQGMECDGKNTELLGDILVASI